MLSSQTRFADCLMARNPAVPQGLLSHNLASPPRRFDVYRNNVRTSLIEALASRFPVAKRLVGEEFFAAMAAEFIRISPPRSPVLLVYGDVFPDFVEGFEPARPLAYLPDVMRLEVARGRAYHAADAAPLSPEELGGIAPERLADLVLKPHPSLSILQSTHPVATIWGMNCDGAEPEPIEDWTGEDVLITRPLMLVEVRIMPPGSAALFLALAEGQTLGQAADEAQRQAETFDLSACFALILQSGAFTGLSMKA